MFRFASFRFTKYSKPAVLLMHFVLVFVSAQCICECRVRCVLFIVVHREDNLCGFYSVIIKADFLGVLAIMPNRPVRDQYM